MNDNARKLYDALSEEYDLGTFEQFSSDIQDENKRRKLYDATIQEYDFGEYDSFSKQLGFGGESIATIQPKAEEVKPVVSPVYSEEQQDSVWGTYKDVGAVKPAVQSGEKETLTTFGEGVKQGADAIYQGNKYFAGEQARFWNGAQQDAKKALEFLDAQGKGFDAKGWDVRKAMDEAAQKQWEKDYEEFLKVKEARRKERKESDMGLWERILHKVADPSMPEPLESRRINPTNMSYQRPLLTLNDALKEADGDVAKARAILEKKASEEQWADKTMREASEAMAKHKPVEGAAWWGQMVPQVAGQATAIGASFIPGVGGVLGKVLSYGTTAGLTASSAGQAMAEARQAGASDEEVWSAGVAQAVIEAGSEQIPLNRLIGKTGSAAFKKGYKAVADNIPEKELEKLLVEGNKRLGGKLLSGKTAKELIKDMGVEGASEFVAEFLGTYVPIIYADKESYPTLLEAVKNGWEGAKAGFAMGGFLGGGSTALSNTLNENRRKKQGFVKLANDKNGNVVEVVGEKDGLVTVLTQDGATKDYTPEELSNIGTFSYDEWKNAKVDVESRNIENAFDKGFNEPGTNTGDKLFAAEQEAKTALGLNTEESIEDFMGGRSVDEVAMGDEDLADKLNAYFKAKAEDEGRRYAIEEMKFIRYAEVDRSIDNTANKDDGMVYSTTLPGGEKIFITGGKVVLDNEGYLDVNQSEELVGLFPDNSKKPIRTSELREKIEVSNAQEAKDARHAEIDAEINAELSAPKNAFSVNAEDGAHTIEVVEDNGNGFFTIVDNGEQKIIDDAFLYEISGGRFGKPAEGVASVASENAQPVTENATETATEAPVTNETETTSEVLPIPTETRGKVKRTAYHVVPIERTLEDFDSNELTEDEKIQFTQANIDEINSELQKILKQEPKMGADIQAYKAAKNQWTVARDEWQKRLDYYNELLNRLNEPAPVVKEVASAVENVAPQATNEMQPVSEGVTENQSGENNEMVEPVGNSEQLEMSVTDNQGNPIDENGRLIVEEVATIDDITDADFDAPARNVQLPALPENVATAIGTSGKPVVIKKNVFEKNGNTHVELEPADSREILKSALYNPNIVGATQPIKRPDYKVAIRTGEKNAIVVLDVFQSKDHVEIVGWRQVNEKGLAKMQRQAEREGGQFLILSPNDGSAAALSALPFGLSSVSKDRNIVSKEQENTQKSDENAENGGEIIYSQEELAEVKEQLGELNATSAPEFAARLFSIKPWKTLEEANAALKELLASYGETLNGQSLAVMPFLDKAQGLINEYNKIQEPRFVEETLENGDKRTTNYNSRGEVATVATERDGKVVSVDSYDEGVLFEHTEYDENGVSTSVTRYDKQGNPVVSGKTEQPETNDVKTKDVNNGADEVITQSDVAEMYNNIQPRDVMGMTPDEFIALHLPKITPESFKRETGLKNDEQRKLVGVIAGADKGGVTIEQAAETILENYGDELQGLGFTGDVQEVRNVIIDILSGGNPRTYAKRGLEQRKQQSIDEQRAEIESVAVSLGFNSVEEWIAYEETFLPVKIEQFKDFDENEYYNNLAKNYKNDTTRESENTRGGSELLQGEQSADNGGERAVGERYEGTAVSGNVQGGNENGAPQGNQQVSSPEIPNSSTASQTSDQAAEVQAAEAEVNTAPTDKQKEAGNYKKGHVRIGAFNVTIEQPRGSVRSGVDKGGKKWEVEMQNTYGYIRGTEGVDGDHIDVFLSNDINGWNGRQVYIIDQRNADGSFDEHKVMLGFNDINEAEEAYLNNYEQGWQGLGAITGVATKDFEKWIASSHRKTKAFAEYKSIKTTEGQNAPGNSGVTSLAEHANGIAESLGLNITLHNDESTITDKEVMQAITEGGIVKGWYNPRTGEIALYMPNMQNKRDVESTILHEAVSHYGIKHFLGKEDFDKFLDGVWEMMPAGVRARFLQYVGADMKNPSKVKMRQVADEYVAHIAETMDLNELERSVWQRIVDYVMNVLRGRGFTDLTRADVERVIKASYADLRTNAEIAQAEVADENGVRFRISNTPAEFDATQKEAVEKRGIVAPGLNEAVIDVVNVPRHDFTGRGRDAIRKAEKWANENIAKEHTYHDGREDGFKYAIDEDAISKFLSSSSTGNSENLGVHLAALKELPNIIDNSVEVEVHPDYQKKDGVRSVENGVGRNDILVHRMYGAVNIDGKVYRAKTTIHEFRDKENKAYDYKITEIELIVSGPSTDNARTNSTSVTGAKLLNGVEKSYDKGVKVLDASEKSSERTMLSKKMSERREEKNRINNAIDTMAGIIYGNKEYAKKRRLKREAERKELAKEIYSSVLKGDFNDVTLSQIDKFIEDATPANPFGRRISQRLPQRMERALRQGARANAVDALFSRISEITVPANERFGEAGRREIEERKKELLKGWAIATGNWHTDLKEFTDDTEPIGEGKDSKVYSSKDGRYVIKASKGKPFGKRFRPDIDNIALFNDVFRDTRYEILGYGEIDGEFVRILQQPIVDFAESTPLTSEERREYMQSLGFEPLNDANTAFADGEIVIADLQKGNAVRDAAGNISVIDADAKLHTKDVGGDYTYPPVETDLPEGTDLGGTMFRRVFHGSGAKFDKFDHSFMGTGEGAQAYGWGTYVTEVEDIGRTYAGVGVTKLGSLQAKLGNIDSAISSLEKEVQRAEKDLTSDNETARHIAAYTLDTASERRKALEEEKAAVEEEIKSYRNLYTVEIPDDNGSNYLYWKADNNQETIGKLNEAYRNMLLERGVPAEDISPYFEPFNKGLSGESIYKIFARELGGDKEASQFLNRQGFVGISYPAEATTGGRADGARNYVIFNENDAQIEDRTMFRVTQEALDVVNEFNTRNRNTARVIFADGEQDLREQLSAWDFAPEDIEVLVNSYKKGTLAEYYPEYDKVLIYKHDVSQKELNGYLWHENAHRAVEYLFSQEEMEEMFLDMAGDKIEAERARLLEAGYEEAEQAEEYIVRGIEEMYLKNPAFVEQNRFKAVEGAREGINRVIPKLKKIIDFIQNGNEEDSTRRGRDDSGLRGDKTEYRREVGRGDAMEMRNAENKGGNAQEATTAGGAELLTSEAVQQEADRMDADEVVVTASAVKALAQKLNTNVNIVEDSNSLPENLRAKKGWYDPKTGEVVVVMDNHVSMEDALQTVLHEIVGHRGLQVVLGDRMGEFLNFVYNNLPKNTRSRVNNYVISQNMKGNPMTQRQAVEEYIAELAERGFEGYNDLWNGIRQWFRDFFRNFMNIEVTDGELRYMLWKNYQRLQVPNVLTEVQERVMENSTNTGDSGLMFRSTDGGIKAGYEKAVTGWWNKFKQGYYDQLRAVRKAQELIAKASGKKIADSEDVYSYAEHLPSINKIMAEQFDMFYMKPFTELLKKLYDKTLGGVNIDDKMLERYANAKHGLERNREMAVKKALTSFEEVKGKKKAVLNEKGYEDWKRRKADILAKKELSWEEKQRELDKLAKTFGAKLGDYSGITAIFDPEDKMKYKELSELAIGYVNSMEEAIGKGYTDEFWKQIKDMTKYSLEQSYKSGLISKNTYDTISGLYSFYVPLRGFTEQTAEDIFDYVAVDHSPLSGVLKRAGGRKSEANNIFATIVNMAHSSIVMGNKNKMKQMALNLAMRHSTPLLSVDNAWYAKVGDEYIPQYPDIKEGMDEKAMADAFAEFEARMKEMEKNGEVVRHAPGLNIRERVVNSWNEQQHAIRVKRNGKEYVVWVNGSPTFANAINGMLKDNDKIVGMGWLDAINSFRSKAVTQYSPTFVFTNLFRDVQSASMVYGVLRGRTALAKFEKNLGVNSVAMMKLYSKYKNDSLDVNNEVERLFKEFLENGGETGYTEMISIEEYQKMLNDLTEKLNVKNATGRAFEAVGDGIEFANRCVENLCRFSAYMTSRQMGMSIMQSVNDAKEVSVNFNRKGSGEMGAKVARKWFMFFNPAVQSVAQRILLTRKYPKRMVPILAAELAAGAAQPYLFASLSALLGVGDDDEEDDTFEERLNRRLGNYYNLTDYRRRSSICFPTAGGVVNIPLSHEARVFFGLGELAASIMTGHEGYGNIQAQVVDILGQAVDILGQSLPFNPVEGWNFGEDLGETLMYNLTPDAIKPFVEVGMNRDFAGNRIHNRTDYNRHLPEWMRGRKGTAEVYKTISRGLSGDESDFGKNVLDENIGALINPSNMEHLVKGYLGGAYTFLEKGAKAAQWALGDEEYAEFRNIPIASSFYTSMSKYEEKPAKERTRRDWEDAFKYYQKEVELLDNKEKAVKNGIKQNFNNAQGVLDAMKNDGDLLVVDVFNDGYKVIKELYSEADVARSAKDMERLNEINNEIYAHKRALVERMEQMAENPLVGYDFLVGKEDTPYGRLETYGDVRDVQEINDMQKRLKVFDDEYKIADNKEVFYQGNKEALDLYDELADTEKEINEIKKYMQDEPGDPEEDMKAIRGLRTEAMNLIRDYNE